MRWSGRASICAEVSTGLRKLWSRTRTMRAPGRSSGRWILPIASSKNPSGSIHRTAARRSDHRRNRDPDQSRLHLLPVLLGARPTRARDAIHRTPMIAPWTVPRQWSLPPPAPPGHSTESRPPPWYSKIRSKPNFSYFYRPPSLEERPRPPNLARHHSMD